VPTSAGIAARGGAGYAVSVSEDGAEMTLAKRLGEKGEHRIVVRLLRAMGEAVGNRHHMVSGGAQRTEDPFWVLIATMLSHRTKEDVTMASCERLFGLAPTPERLARTPVRTIEKTIYPVGFYRTKARAVRDAASRLVVECNGVVPDSMGELLRLRGVGRKTANMVITMGYGKDAICVDTHVHRVSNRLGLVSTNTPNETEYALMEVLPMRWWVGSNEVMVGFGRRVCRPVIPYCSRCPFEDECPMVNVDRHR
jgi:endonuclease-3